MLLYTENVPYLRLRATGFGVFCKHWTKYEWYDNC